MKRTGKKSRIGRSYKSKWADGYQWLYKYDRKHVAHYHGDVKHLPFSRTSYVFWKSWWFKSGVLTHIERYLLKHVGENADMVFHKFSRMGWKNTFDMYEMWSHFVDSCYNYKKRKFYVSEEGLLMNKSLEDAIEQSEESETSEESEESQISERLKRCHMLHNSKVKVPKVWCCEHTLRNGIYAGRMGKFYVEYEGRVILCQVYHVICRNSRHHRLVEQDYREVSILGLFRHERIFQDYIWYGANENLEDVKYHTEYHIIRYHDLYPMVKIEEVRRQLKKPADS